jgi:hypothetical protein
MLQRRAVRTHRLLGPSELEEHVPEVVPAFVVVRNERGGSPVALGGFGQVPATSVREREVVPDLMGVRSEAERLSSLENLQIITGTYSSGLSYAASQVAERRGGLLVD